MGFPVQQGRDSSLSSAFTRDTAGFLLGATVVCRNLSPDVSEAPCSVPKTPYWHLRRQIKEGLSSEKSDREAA